MGCIGTTTMNMKTAIKRCNSELLELYGRDDLNNIKLHVHSNEIHFIVEKTNGNTLKFILSERYPFREPRLMINDTFYKNHLAQNPNCERINKFIEKYMGIHCLCCSSIIYDKNWSPAFRISNVLSEIAQVNIVKKYMMNYLIIDDICCKKNIDTDTIGIYILDFLSDNSFSEALFCKKL